MDIGVATLIGSGLNLTGGLFSNEINKKIARENLAYQREANEKNMRLTKEANEANIQLQRDINNQNIAFQQQENDITRMREDNAVQRAAADMTAAGLSKTLAAGHPASAQGLTAPQAVAPQVEKAQVRALNNQFRYESALQRMNIAGLLQDMAVKGEQLKQSEKLNEAQVDLLKARAVGQNNVNDTFRTDFENTQLLKLAQVASHEAQTSVYKAEARLKEIEGDYRADLLQNEVDKGIAQIGVFRSQNRLYGEQITLTQKQISEYAYKIAKEIAETNHLNSQTELAVQELAKKKLELGIMQYNFDYSKQHSMRTTDSNMRLMGLDVTAFSHGLTNILSGITHGTIFKDIGNFLFK